MWNQLRLTARALTGNFSRRQRQPLTTNTNGTLHDAYDRGGELLQNILAVLDDPTRDLARMDAFNSRGRTGRLELLLLLEKQHPLSSEDRVLDIGCGIGGTLRYLREERNCMRLFGIDATLEYIQVAQELQRRFFPRHSIQYLHGSALELPIVANSIDVVWTEHVQMNIQDKLSFYREAGRVLRPGGCLAFHDVLLKKPSLLNEVVYPCPWAENPSTSHLVPEPVLKETLREAGFQLVEWRDMTEETLNFLTPIVEERNLHKEGRRLSGPGVHLLMGDNASSKVNNHWQNLLKGRTLVAMGTALLR